MKLLNKLTVWIAVGAVALGVMSSCGSSRGAMRASETGRVSTQRVTDNKQSASKGKSSGKGSAKPAAPAARINFGSMTLTPTLESLLREADSWIGTPYLYGGNDRNGVDCSGFVCQVFRNSVGLSLPRTSREQHKYCREIGRESLEPGDLVFFTIRGGSTVGHVGIYIGDDMMVHASSSKGVVISSLSSNYYVVNYYGSGRVDQFMAMTSAEKSKSVKKPSTKSSAKPAAAPRPVSKPAAAPRKPSAKPAPEVTPEPEVPTVVSPQIKPEVQLAKAETQPEKVDEPDKGEIAKAIASRVGRIGRMNVASATTAEHHAAPSAADADDSDDFFD